VHLFFASRQKAGLQIFDRICVTLVDAEHTALLTEYGAVLAEFDAESPVF